MNPTWNPNAHQPWDGASHSGPGDHGGEGGTGPQLNFTGSTYAGGSHSHVGRGTFPGDTGAGSAGDWHGTPRERARRAPKGYTRSDERILEDLVERFAADALADVRDVTVQIQGGRAVLAGTVPHRAIKHRIEDIVDGCPGVSEIDNRIRVSGKYGETAV